MSNLSDLLPAGGGAKVITATADGNLATGQTVALQSNGTVKGVSADAISAALGTAVAYNDGTDSCAIAYDSTNNKILIAYKNGGNNAGEAIVGTISGTTLSFGTAVQFANTIAGDGNRKIGICFNSTEGKFVIVYRDSNINNHGRAITATISGTSVSFGSSAEFIANVTNFQACSFDSTSNRVVIVYSNDSVSGSGYAVVAKITGTSLSFGSQEYFEAGYTYYPVPVYDSNANKTVFFYRDGGNSNYGTAIVATVSDLSISFGSAVVFESAQTEHQTAAFDSANNKIVVAYADSGNSGYGTAIVGTVSGTSISFGSAAVFESASTGNAQMQAAYNVAAGKTVIGYVDSGNSSYGTYVEATVSGTSVSFSTPAVFESATVSYTPAFAAYDSTANVVVFAYRDGGNANYGTAIAYRSQYSNSGDFAGITNQAINNSASGEVVVEGGVITNSALLPFAYTGTTGSAAVFESATSNSFGIAFDSSNNKVVVTYDDEGNSSYGTAVVGTVSGTSISWGTPVVFNSGNINGSNCWTAFDSNVNKTVTIFRDNGNSEYGTAIVGTVSGTSISFGTKAVYNSASAYATASDICFDSTQNKLLICYRDVGNNHYGTAIVGTISGTSISFGTEVVFDSTQVEMIGCVHDPSTGKNVVANKEGSGNNGVAQVATISGTSVSFGSQATFNSTSTYYINAVYDSNSNKVVLCYENNGGGNLGQAKVCTISGTSISFGTAATFSEAGDAVNWVTAGFDSNQNRVVVATVATGQTISRFNSGAVSGTDITFGTPQTFLSGNAYPLGQRIVFDTSQNTNVWVYKDNANSQYGTGIAMQLSGANPTLTVGSTYYVQDDGTLSTTSSSVTAGKAIANTTLLLKG